MSTLSLPLQHVIIPRRCTGRGPTRTPLIPGVQRLITGSRDSSTSTMTKDPQGRGSWRWLVTADCWNAPCLDETCGGAGDAGGCGFPTEPRSSQPRQARLDGALGNLSWISASGFQLPKCAKHEPSAGASSTQHMLD